MYSQVPLPTLNETLHVHLPGIPLFVAAVMAEGIPLDESTTQPCQYIELCILHLVTVVVCS